MKKGIEYADKSWNCYTGCKMTGCAVGKNCWAYRRALMLAGRFGYDKDDPFKPTIHWDKFDVPIRRKKPTRWDTCFMGDIAYAETHWLVQILEVVKKCPQHIFYFLTKRPDLLAENGLTFPENAWVGVTVNSQDDVWRIANLMEISAEHLWVSFEPLYSSILTSLKGITWCVLGAQTNPELQPKKEWVDEIIRMAEYRDIPVFIKPNVTVVEPRMELPEEIRKVA